MTTVISTGAGTGILATGSERTARQGSLRAAWDKYRAFRASIAELGALTDRQLADVGLARRAIRGQARKTVYGN